MALLNRRLVGVSLAVSMSVASATPVFAQEALVRDNDSFVLFDVNGGAPTRLAGGATVLVPFGKPASRTKLNAVEVQASAGMGGVRVAGGAAFLDEVFGPDVLLSLTRTWASPRGAAPHATYVGLEAGYVWICLRLSAGVAHRVGGPTGPRATVVTWQAGVQLPLAAFR